jgi:hypothetical protein
MKKRTTKKYGIFALLILFLIAWMVLLAFIEPEEIVGRIGVENTYIIVFLAAVFGGLSTLTGTSFFLLIATFADGGSNPLLLGLSGGAGIFISDSLFFLIARHGAEILRTKAKRFSETLVRFMRRAPPWGVYGGVYVYLGFTPLPNDLLMIALALFGMSYRKLIPVLLAGSITIATLTAFGGQQLLSWFQL